MNNHMKKKITTITSIIIIVLLILLFPKKVQYNDGGTVTYTSLVYKIIVWHESIITETGHDFKTGTDVYFFDFYNDDYYFKSSK